MSQQSNPATLREALREVNSLVHQMAIELDPIPAQPRVEYWTRKIEEVICTALAASGTEAAPSDDEHAERLVWAITRLRVRESFRGRI